MEETTMRMIERILSVIIGGFSIYLGFFLFKIIPHVDTGEGKFKFPGGSFHLTRTGPGVFFALFGCAIVFWSFSHPIEVRTGGDLMGMVPEQETIREFIGLGPEEKAKYQIWIQNLNRIYNTIRSETPSIEKDEAENTIKRIKLVLIQRMLDNPIDPEFGAFKMKILSNPLQNFGEKWQKWADIYNILNTAMRKYRVVQILIIILPFTFHYGQAETNYLRHRTNQLLTITDNYNRNLQFNFITMKNYVPPNHFPSLIKTKLYITLEDKIVSAQAWPDNSIRISAATLLFLEELAVTLAWYEYSGIKNRQPIINYVLLLRKQMRKDILERNIIPTMTEALGVPSEEIWSRSDQDQIKEFSQNILKSMATWIIAHEMGHIALGHLTQKRRFPSILKRAQYKRQLEFSADEFAMKLMARLRLSPIGMALTMVYYCLLFPVRLDFKYEEDWQEYLANENHPIWPERFDRLSIVFMKYAKDYHSIDMIKFITQNLEGISRLLRDEDVLSAMIVGSEKLTFENIMYFEPLKNIDKKYFRHRDD